MNGGSAIPVFERRCRRDVRHRKSFPEENVLTNTARYVSLLVVKHETVNRQRKRLLQALPDLHALLRGSLIERTIRHRKGCPKCDRGGGHPVWVLSVGYPGGRTGQISLHRDQVPQVRQWLDNYRELKTTLETVCELNQQVLLAERSEAGSRRQARD